MTKIKIRRKNDRSLPFPEKEFEVLLEELQEQLPVIHVDPRGNTQLLPSYNEYDQEWNRVCMQRRYELWVGRVANMFFLILGNAAGHTLTSYFPGEEILNEQETVKKLSYHSTDHRKIVDLAKAIQHHVQRNIDEKYKKPEKSINALNIIENRHRKSTVALFSMLFIAFYSSFFLFTGRGPIEALISPTSLAFVAWFVMILRVRVKNDAIPFEGIEYLLNEKEWYVPKLVKITFFTCLLIVIYSFTISFVLNTM